MTRAILLTAALLIALPARGESISLAAADREFLREQTQALRWNQYLARLHKFRDQVEELLGRSLDWKWRQALTEGKWRESWRPMYVPDLTPAKPAKPWRAIIP